MAGKEQQEADEGADLGDEQDGAAADAVGPAAENGGKKKLEEGIGRANEDQEEGIADAESLAVVLLIGEEDAEADEIDENDEEDGE